MELYKINQQIQEVLEKGFVADEETGEILFDSENLDELQNAFDEKVDNIACYIKNLDSLMVAIADEQKELQARKKTAEKKADFLKKYLTDMLAMREMKKFESGKNKISFRKSQSVQIINADAISKDYIIEKVEKSVDKKSILADLKQGIEVDGAELLIKNNLILK